MTETTIQLSRFDVDILSLFANRISTDKDFAHRVWSSLANVDWTHESGETDGHTFRSAGRLLATIRGTADDPYCYMEFYCQSPTAQIDEEFAEGMATRGWTGEVLT